MEYPRWSEWRKWDLHFHTPSSYDYKNKWTTNKVLIDWLVRKNISVVAITDHHFIDVERIKELQKLWEWKITILPWIEFLSDARWKEPIHFIGIFWEDSNFEYIWWQLQNNTNIKKIYWPEKKENNCVYCSLQETAKLIHDLWWIVTIHAGTKSNTIDNITNSLPHLEAQKEDIAKFVDVFELWKESDYEIYQNIVNKELKRLIWKSLPLILCSDNHDIQDYKVKQDLWIKGDPTFKWLKQILYEPEERVYIWKEPDILQKVNANKTEYISSLNIKRLEWYNGSKGVRFKDEKIDLNHWLVTIIWNKWSWKSALVDIIWYLWNTKQYEKSSFLSKNRFLKDGLASNFNASLTFEDWSSIDKNLWEKIWESSLERVRYLPQNYFNDITNEIESLDFVDTINNVVFNHLPESERLWKVSFKEFVKLKTEVAKSNIENISAKISGINKEIVELEISMQAVEIEKLGNQKTLKEQELKAQKESLSELKKEKPKTTTKKNSNWEQLKNMENLNKELWNLDSYIQKTSLELSNLVRQKQELNTIKSKLQSFEKMWKDFIKEYENKIEGFDIKVKDILKITISYTKIDKKLRDIDKKIQEKKELLMSEVEINDILDLEIKNKIQETSLVIKRNSIIQEQDKIKKALSDVELKQQEYNEKIKKIEQKINDIEWNENIPNTLKYFERKISDLTKRNKNWKTLIEEKLLEKEQQRNELLNEIFNEKEWILNLYGKFKEPIDRIIQGFEDSQININVDFQIDKNFYIEFFKYINQSKKGSFYWKDEGNDMLNKIMDWKDVSSFKWIENLLNTIVDYLKNDKRDWKNEKSNIFEQIKDMEWFYNYLFSLKYLNVNYELKSGEKTLDQLSPWEKWNLLLIFYLMIDKETIPLVIDQPEDNLDNKSVFEMLSKFIKEAKKRRQIILVTHNPNLAIWADAEQIIYTNIDKQKLNEFSYISGSIENPIINNKIVEILEWTMPAFQKRELKYQK